MNEIRVQSEIQNRIFTFRDIQVSIQIMQSFVELRKFISTNAGIFQRLDKVEQKLLQSDENYIDEKEIYHFGASLKDLGKKWFAFSKMDISSVKVLDKLKEGSLI